MMRTIDHNIPQTFCPSGFKPAPFLRIIESAKLLMKFDVAPEKAYTVSFRSWLPERVSHKPVNCPMDNPDQPRVSANVGNAALLRQFYVRRVPHRKEKYGSRRR